MGAIFGFTGARDPALHARMSAALSHRGSRGAVLGEGDTGTLGYIRRHDETTERRLGVGLISDGDVTLALAGYLAGRPAGATIEVVNRSDEPLAALVAAYRSRGPDFIEDLDGAFAIAVLDGRRLILARDGSGERSLYYATAGGRHLFASEPKAIFAAPFFPRRLRAAAVAEYLTFCFQPGSETMVEGLNEIMAGHMLVLDGPAAPGAQRRYFFFERNEPEERPEEEWVGRFRDEVGAHVQRMLPPGEPVGIFLSGGIDSSVVAAEVARRHDRPVRSFAIHFGKKYPHELEFAAAVARRCGTDHEEVEIRPRDFLPGLRRIIWHLDDPIGDPVAMPNFELAGHASREVRWIFNGEGGDPCFGGPKNLPMLLSHWYGGVPREPGFRERAYLRSFQRAFDDLNHLLTPDFRARHHDPARLESHLTPFFESPDPPRFLDKLTAINIRLKGAHLILPKVERMTGAWALTTVAPLFCDRLVRLSFQIPPGLKLNAGVEKVILKRAYADALPPEVIARPKSGMRVPVHYWFQGEMKSYARKILNRRRLREMGIFDPARVKQLLDYNIENGPGRYGLRLWMLITFDIWHRIVIEGESP